MSSENEAFIRVLRCHS